MTTECHHSTCPHHGIHEGDEGPFCFEAECRQPHCYNRPPAARYRSVQDGWLHGEVNGIFTRIPKMVTIRDDMSKNCQQWGELGEARLRGWDCAGCRWKEISDV